MRISDWISDVCSSDLIHGRENVVRRFREFYAVFSHVCRRVSLVADQQGHSAYCRHRSVRAEPGGLQPGCPDAAANLTEAWSFSKCREKSRAACRAADRFAAERADQGDAQQKSARRQTCQYSSPLEETIFDQQHRLIICRARRIAQLRETVGPFGRVERRAGLFYLTVEHPAALNRVGDFAERLRDRLVIA